MSDPDSDESELQKAIALSLEEPEKPNIVESDDFRKTAEASEPPKASSGPLRILGLDRRKMEEDRLARAKKRKPPSISPPPLTQRPRLQVPAASATGIHKGSYGYDVEKAVTDYEPIVTSCDSDTKTRTPSNLKPGAGQAICTIPHQLLDSKPIVENGVRESKDGAVVGSDTKHAQRSHAFSIVQQDNLLASGIHFPHGTVRKTWAFGYARKDDIKIEEVLQKHDLQVAILSAYQWDEEWILSKLDLSKSKVICVVQADGEEMKAQMRANVPPNIRFCFPSMAGQINCMHSKLQLLSHPTHLRIVVPSANLVPYDWGEQGGLIENIVFLIDLPRHPRGLRTEPSKLTPFGRELRRFLKAMEIDSSTVDSLLDFDYSRSAHLAFVHSIGGSHHKSTWKYTGYCGLGSSIKELGLASKGPMNIDYVTASIGNLTNSFIKSLYLAAQGDDGLTELNWRTSKNPSSGTELEVAKEIEKGFRIYFPSRETVAKSRGGVKAGGTICFQSKWFDLATFPRSLIRDCKSKRPGLLMHNKMLFIRSHDPLQSSSVRDYQESVAWAYVGSANLSESAWGRLVKDRSTKEPRLNVRNWECGVVVPISGLKTSYGSMCKAENRKNDDSMNPNVRDGSLHMDVFNSVVPVPMVVPGEEYGDKRPWFYTELPRFA